MHVRKRHLLTGSLLGCLLALAGISLPAGAQTTPSNEWTWMGGNNAGGPLDYQPGVYGTLETPAAGNIPSGRTYAVSWTDKNGRLWLFGGTFLTTYLTYLNDLWVYDPATSEWAWMAGSSTESCGVNGCGQSGVYGTLGKAAAGNTPGGRDSAASWTDSNGKLWLFGGSGFDFIGQWGILNDMWVFDPSINQWAWMGGSNTLPGDNTGPAGVYGTLGTPSAANHPGGLFLASSWSDQWGNGWVLGGWGNDANGLNGMPNDLWEFYPSTGEWAWMDDSSTFSNPWIQPSVYGALGTPGAGNIPGTRWESATWTDENGNLWLFGGGGFDADQNQGYLNELWEFNTSSNEWAWMGGNSTMLCGPNSEKQNCGRAGVYGTRGTPAAGNIPGGRQSAVSWTDTEGHFWLFGGLGFNGNGAYTDLNDLWEFNPSTGEWTWMDGEAIAQSGAGVYGNLGVPAAGNIPGERDGAVGWVDNSGNLWLFGGNAVDVNGVIGFPNDLWEYQLPSTVTDSPAATPVFSPEAGTYASAQSVTITSATPEAAIYYTTDGTTPTTSSTAYTGPIGVSSTETIKAIATASGYLASAVAIATYTIPPDFTLTINPASVAVQSGKSGTTTVTVQGENGFGSNVSFACSGLPEGAACSFALQTAPTTQYITQTTLTVTTSETTARLHRSGRPLIPSSVLAVALCCFGWKKRRRLQMLLLLAVSAAGLSLLNGCSASLITFTQTTTSTITVTATSGSLKHTAPFLLTVN
jgi:N-acetylneuraminic acid mutarotase